MIEVVLREADLEFSSPVEGAEWTWTETVTELTKALERTWQVQDVEGESASKARSRESEARGGISGKLVSHHLPWKVAPKDAPPASSTPGATATGARHVTWSKTDYPLKISKARGQARLQFWSGLEEDLVRLNPHLTQLNLLEFKDDPRWTVDTTEVQLLLKLDKGSAGVRHAFAVKRASGPWAPLADDPTKAALSELLLSKFVEPLHDDLRLWPRPTEDPCCE